MRAAILILTVAICACGASREEQARDIAAHDLADPAAAQFRNVKQAGEYCFTGELNAKNRMGAYTGYRPFIVDMRKKEVAIVPDEPSGDMDSDTAIKQVRVDVFSSDCGIAATAAEERE